MATPTISSPAQAFIDGAFVDARTGEMFDTYAPSTGEVLASVAACGAEDVDHAVVSARAAFERGTWERMPPTIPERARTVGPLPDVLRLRRGRSGPERGTRG